MKTDLLTQLRCLGLPEPVAEYRFAEHRGWRFDYAYPPPLRIAVERDGGVWTGGRHVRGKGYIEDCRKYSEAAILGWLVVRYSVDMEASGEAAELVRRALAARGEGVPCTDAQ